jgi:hypothetical protein
VNTNPANAQFQGELLGDLVAGANGDHLRDLVDKWFFGLDHPEAATGTVYRAVSGTLFGDGPSASDVFQAGIGDCGFLAPLLATANRSPQSVRDMFIDNGDDTWTVRFFKPNGRVDYVTVDRTLPTVSDYAWNGASVRRSVTTYYSSLGERQHSNSWAYPHSIDLAENVLWPALVEKAYAQVNESGWLKLGAGRDGNNSYDAALNGVFPHQVMQQTTGRVASMHGWTASSRTAMINAWRSGQLIVLDTNANSATLPANMVPNHSYALTRYDAASRIFHLSNPWGVFGSGDKLGSLTLTWTEIRSSFSRWYATIR